MPRYRISLEERYPDWALSERLDKTSVTVEMNLADYQEYDRVAKAYAVWQKHIERLYTQAKREAVKGL